MSTFLLSLVLHGFISRGKWEKEKGLTWQTFPLGYLSEYSSIQIQHIKNISEMLTNGQLQSFADVLQNSCSKKFRKFHRKKPVLKSLLNKVAVLKACNFIKKGLQHKCLYVKFTNFWRTAFFIEHLQWLLLNGIYADKNSLKGLKYSEDYQGCRSNLKLPSL